MSNDLLIGLVVGFLVGAGLTALAWALWWRWERKQPMDHWDGPWR